MNVNVNKKDISKIAGETRKVSKRTPPPKYFLKKPKITEEDKIKFFELVDEHTKSQAFFALANIPDYLFWDKFQYKTGTEKKFSPKQIWYFVRQLRNISSTKTHIHTEKKVSFKWLRLPSLDEYLHRIDMFAGGRLFNMGPNMSESNRQTYLNRGLIEEAIASSQLEGAHTTRKAAKEMLVQKKQPKNESEQMILNNYKTMTSICDDFKHRDLSLELLFEMHSMLTKETVNEFEQNRLREDRDEIVVQGQIGTEEYITHVPPSHAFIKKEIDRLINYANDKNSKSFTHPIIKAILLHFWIGYLHPFTDGNGRLARAIFYWYLLRKEYWTFMYLPISTIIKKAPMQYAMAYIYSEQDELDVTYFFDFHIKKILQAINEFEEYLDEKIEENSQIEKNIGGKFNLNERQKQLIYYLVSDKNPSVSVSSHMTLHNISRQTASKDLGALEGHKLVIPKRSGKFIKYYPSKNLLKESF
ncbi:Fic family protein [Candidatus Pacebacteria bacterium]|nr:Fic family protein [Candidatus Paceibacterota bacterium]